jgi:hypothetical protein
VAVCERRTITVEETSVAGVVLSEREVAEHGRDLVVPVPLRLCPGCREALFRSPIARACPWVALGFAIPGAASLYFGWWWAALGLLWLAGLPLVVRLAVRQRQRGEVVRLLRRTPIYRQLLTEYPDAEVLAG